MKRVKQRLSIFLVFVLVLGILPVSPGGDREVPTAQAAGAIASGTCSGTNIQWQITEDTDADWDLAQGTPYKLTLTGSGAMPDWTVFNQDEQRPWYSYRASIMSISIAEGITTIGDYAFYQFSSLKSFDIPDNITSIGQWALSNCSMLTTVTCGSGLKSIGEEAFAADHALTTVNLNNGLTEIQKQAFAFCYALENVSLPESLVTLGEYAFRETVITSVTIPGNTTRIDSGAFSSCMELQEIKTSPENPHFTTIDNILYEIKEGKPYRALAYALGTASKKPDVTIADGTEIIDNALFFVNNRNATKVTSITLPDSLKHIYEFAFYSTKISEIYLPDNVESIGDRALASCDKLETVYIGSGLQELNANSFSYDVSLKTITVSSKNPYLDAVDNVVFNKEHTILCFYALAKPDTVYSIPDTVNTLQKNAINQVPSLTELYIPASLTNVMYASIGSNTKLTSIYFAGNAPEMTGSSSKVNSAIINNADNLILYKTADAVGWDVADWTDNFTLLEWNPENTQMESGNFGLVCWKYEGSMGRITFTGAGEIPDFESAQDTPWYAFSGDIQTMLTEQVTGIGNHAFSNAGSLVRVETDDSLQKIGDSTFADCDKLTFLDIRSVDSIGTEAFKNDSAIKDTLTLDKVSRIGASAFQGCSAITEATLGSSLESLEENVFADCMALENCIVPESVPTIKTGAFRGCGALRSINIPAAVTAIASKAFEKNTALERVYFYGGVPKTFASDSFSQGNTNMTLYYRNTQASWKTLGGTWNGLPLVAQEKFYTEKHDHYSFSNSSASFGYSNNYRIPRQRYVDVLDNNIISGTYYYSVNPKWEGSCYGMAASTLEFYENSDAFSVTDYNASAKSLYDIPAPQNANAVLTKQIEAYQISQFKASVAGCGGEIVRKKDQYRELIRRVEEFERSGGLSVDSQADPVVMSLFSNYSGHAVIPVSVNQAANGDYLLKVYDSNVPGSLQTVKIYNDLSGISYGRYTSASYTDYSTIAAAMSGVQLHSGTGDQSLYLSIDKEYGAVADTAGRSLAQIPDAYEQKFFNGSEDDTFSGIKSFVVPKGDYHLYSEYTEDVGSGDITFYMASEDTYAQITSTDETAVLTVNDADTENTGLKIGVQSNSDQEETSSFTIMNRQGMERKIDVEGGNATIVVDKEDTITVQVPAGESVSIDGKEVDVENGTVISSFKASAGETGLKIKEFEMNASRDQLNQLNGNVYATVISNADTDKNITVTTDCFDEKGNPIATYTEETEIHLGMNFITVSLQGLETALEETQEKMGLLYRLTLTDENGSSVTSDFQNTTVSFDKTTTSPDPGKTPEPTAKPSPTVPVATATPTASPTAPGTVEPKPSPIASVTAQPSPTAVPENVVKQIKLKKKNITIGVGETYQIQATVRPANAKNKALSYKASSRVAAVSAKGKVTGKKTGTCMITIQSANGISAVMKVVVKKAPKKISLNKKRKTLYVGKTFQVKVKLPKNTASNKIKYSSSKKSVASVSASGKITARKKGNATITVQTFNRKKAKIKIKVKKKRS